MREGNLEAPTRHPLDWKNAAFYSEAAAFAEMERVFDICHGCRRCVNLCTAFPTLFDLVDASKTLEVDGVDKQDYWKVVDQCYLCDTCYMTKCPYVPPHSWNVDFPHLMLRAKAIKFKKGEVTLRDKMLSATDAMGKLNTIPVVVQTVNAMNKNKTFRNVLDSALGVHKDREMLEMIPGTAVTTVERCAGHDGTWGVKKEYFEASMKIGRPVFRQLADAKPDWISSDCPIAARHIVQGIKKEQEPAAKAHPLTLLRKAYGI